jgi:hypothetical protein
MRVLQKALELRISSLPDFRTSTEVYVTCVESKMNEMLHLIKERAVLRRF